MEIGAAGDAKLLDFLAERQRRSIEAMGLDAARFAARTELAEFTPLNRAMLRAAAGFAAFIGRRELAERFGAIADYMKAAAKEITKLPALLEAAARHRRPPATRYQRRDDHVFMCATTELLEAGLRVCDLDRARFSDTIQASILATAPIGRCNAEIYSSDDGGRFAVLIDDEVGRVCAQMGFVVAGLIAESEGRVVLQNDILAARISPNSAAGRLFTSLVSTFVASGSTRGAVPLALPSKFEVDFMAMIGQLAFVWALAHELAHGFCGHLKSGSTMALHDDDGAQAELAFSLEAETAADAVACEIGRGVCVHWGAAPWLVKIAAASQLLLYDRVYALIGEIHAPQLSAPAREAVIRAVTRHPTPGERLAKLVETNMAEDVWLSEVIGRLRALPIPMTRAHRRWNALIAAFETTR